MKTTSKLPLSFAAISLICAGCSVAQPPSPPKDVCIEGYLYREYTSYGPRQIPVPLFQDDKPKRCVLDKK